MACSGARPVLVDEGGGRKAPVVDWVVVLGPEEVVVESEVIRPSPRFERAASVPDFYPAHRRASLIRRLATWK